MFKPVGVTKLSTRRASADTASVSGANQGRAPITDATRTRTCWRCTRATLEVAASWLLRHSVLRTVEPTEQLTEAGDVGRVPVLEKRLEPLSSGLACVRQPGDSVLSQRQLGRPTVVGVLHPLDQAELLHESELPADSRLAHAVETREVGQPHRTELLDAKEQGVRSGLQAWVHLAGQLAGEGSRPPEQHRHLVLNGVVGSTVGHGASLSRRAMR